jgi:hypothetical protein
MLRAGIELDDLCHSTVFWGRPQVLLRGRSVGRPGACQLIHAHSSAVGSVHLHTGCMQGDSGTLSLRSARLEPWRDNRPLAGRSDLRLPVSSPNSLSARDRQLLVFIRCHRTRARMPRSLVGDQNNVRIDPHLRSGPDQAVLPRPVPLIPRSGLSTTQVTSAE